MAKAVAPTKGTTKGKAPVAPAKTNAVRASGMAAAATPAPRPAAARTVSVKDLATDVAEHHDLTYKQASIIMADVFARVVDHLKAGERVRIGGLGIIEVKDRAARIGRNPATGETIEIKASRKVAFRAAKDLKDAL